MHAIGDMRLHSNAKIELLRRVPLFARCSRRELAHLAAAADELDVPAGKTLAAEGKTGREFVVIVEGAADVRRKGRKINALGPGDFLGEIALVTGRPRTATVTTTSPSRVLVLTARDFKRLLEEMPPVAVKVLAAVAERLAGD